LWAHRVVLGTVSPFLKSLLSDFERRGDDVITLFLPLIKVYSSFFDVSCFFRWKNAKLA
jgi:hypothetical protein